MTDMSLSGRAAIVGLGATEFSKNSGRTELRLAMESTLAALAGSQPKPPAPTCAFASRISVSVASRTTPPQRSRARSAFGRFTGRLISIALASVSARRLPASIALR